MVILVADDEIGIRKSLEQLFKTKHTVILCEEGTSALKTLEKTGIDLVITDHQMPGLTGLELIKRGKELSPSTSFILMTAYGSVEQAVQAISSGADDYLMKPFDLSEMEHRVKRIDELQAWKNEAALKSDSATGVARLIGKSQAMSTAREFIRKVAAVPSPVLLLGPSGSGKEVIAKAIHESGPRATRSFIAINCASLNEQLMESELFGHEKGSFTGATSAKPGKFELAKGGTLFLDEVGELTSGLQAKLLRVLQEREFFRVGGVRQIQSDARVIAATHCPLKGMVKEGTFREDLYFRLNVLTYEISPLCERSEDIPLLVDALWERMAKELGKHCQLEPETREILIHYSYPGNVRELQNVLERLLVLSRKTASPDLLPPEFLSSSPNPESTAQLNSQGLSDRLDDLERTLIIQAMESSRHNQVRAAELLRVTRGGLQYKLKKYGYQPTARIWAPYPSSSKQAA